MVSIKFRAQRLRTKGAKIVKYARWLSLQEDQERRFEEVWEKVRCVSIFCMGASHQQSERAAIVTELLSFSTTVVRG